MTRSVTPQEAQRWLAAGEAILIDVREPAEFAAGPQAMSLPLGALPAALATLPGGRKRIFQCLSGARGTQACRLASEGSDEESFNLAGGIAAWQAAALPVVGGSGPRLSIFRQVQMIVGTMVALLVIIGFAGVTFAFAFALAGLLGAMLAFAGATGWCGLALLLGRMPWNRAAPVG
jgi:rhodanese-related sulfurtransferase